MSRLAQICPSLKHLTLSGMGDLTEDGQMSIVKLFVMIVQSRPPLTHLDLHYFNENNSTNTEAMGNAAADVGKLLLDAL